MVEDLEGAQLPPLAGWAAEALAWAAIERKEMKPNEAEQEGELIEPCQEGAQPACSSTEQAAVVASSLADLATCGMEERAVNPLP